MKKNILILVVLALSGCTYEGKNYFEQPQYLIRDPHFSDYQSKRDTLESKYLNKEITYADYVQQRDELDKNYSKEVQTRESNMAPKE